MCYKQHGISLHFSCVPLLHYQGQVSSIKVSRHQDHVQLSDWQVPVYFLNADIDPRNPPDNNAPDRDCVHTLADPKPLPEQVSTQGRTTGPRSRFRASKYRHHGVEQRRKILLTLRNIFSFYTKAEILLFTIYI